jgi:hypothetical protein
MKASVSVASGLALLVLLSVAGAFAVKPVFQHGLSLRRVAPEKPAATEVDAEIDATTRKWGLEGGLLKSAKAGNMDQAKMLLKKYGSAYLVTSITLAAISFSICYALVDAGVDVGSLLAKVGIAVDTGSTANTAGTAAIAYIGSCEYAASCCLFPVCLKKPLSKSDANNSQLVSHYVWMLSLQL